MAKLFARDENGIYHPAYEDQILKAARALLGRKCRRAQTR